MKKLAALLLALSISSPAFAGLIVGDIYGAGLYSTSSTTTTVTYDFINALVLGSDGDFTSTTTVTPGDITISGGLATSQDWVFGDFNFVVHHVSTSFDGLFTLFELSGIMTGPGAFTPTERNVLISANPFTYSYATVSTPGTLLMLGIGMLMLFGLRMRKTASAAARG